MHVLVIAFVFIQFSIVNSINTSTLRFVHIVWRHGDRSPADPTFPTDTQNPEWSWPNGWGELTEIGMMQHYVLGSQLRKRYVDSGYLPPNYNASLIYVRSSDYNRTIMSALSNLAGMYPPEDGRNVGWQPIPVHSISPRQNDPVLWMDRPCPNAHDLYFNEILTSEAAKKAEDDYADLLTFLREKTGHPLSTLDDMRFIFDPLNCERIHNETHRWPDWVTPPIFDQITELHAVSRSFSYHDPRMQRFRGSLLFSEIAHRSEQKTRNDPKLKPSSLKYYVYSAHDSTIIALLENLGAYSGIPPEYSTALLFELYERSGRYFIEVWHINETGSDTLVPVPVKGCESLGVCSLEKFIELADGQTPDDWYAECGFSTPGSQMNREAVAAYILGATTALFFILFLITLALLFRFRSSRKFTVVN